MIPKTVNDPCTLAATASHTTVVVKSRGIDQLGEMRCARERMGSGRRHRQGPRKYTLSSQLI
jgi:hypothetical protein